MTNWEEPLPGLSDLEQGKWKDCLQIWEGLVAALKTILEDSILRSKDGGSLALYFKAGTNLEETGKRVMTICSYSRTRH